MKIRFFAALLLAALAISLFTGCAADAVRQLDAAEDAVENRLDMAEDAIEKRIEAMITDPAVPKSSTPTEPTPAATPAATGPSHTLPAAAPQLLTKEDAEKIALEHADFTADQVQRLRTELDYDRGRAEYEVDFRVDRWEYDYEIDAETGKILSFDKDFDD